MFERIASNRLSVPTNSHSLRVAKPCKIVHELAYVDGRHGTRVEVDVKRGERLRRRCIRTSIEFRGVVKAFAPSKGSYCAQT